MGQYKIHITKENGEKLKPEIFETQQHAIDWSVEQRIKTGHNYFLEDLSQDPEWFRENAIKQIIKEEISNEGITLEKKVEAILQYIEEEPDMLAEIMLKRIAIKEKYPTTKV